MLCLNPDPNLKIQEIEEELNEVNTRPNFNCA